MAQPSRTAEILTVFRGIPRGQARSAAAVVTALTDRGHTFGAGATTADRRIRLVESTLARLTARGDLITSATVDGVPTWTLPHATTSLRTATAVPARPAPAPSGSFSRALTALAVTMCLAAAILLIIAVWPR